MDGVLQVLYLDFDGVLHPDAAYFSFKRGIELRAPGHTLFENIDILEQMLAPHPEVRIVLSTSWVYAKDFKFAKERLSPVLQKRVIGATFHRRHHDLYHFRTMSRGQQILADIQRRQPGAWLSIDDHCEDWPEQAGFVVQCDGQLGLQCADTRRCFADALSIVFGHGQLRQSRGKLNWQGDLEQMRRDA